jgi:hypothetical protein
MKKINEIDEMKVMRGEYPLIDIFNAKSIDITEKGKNNFRKKFLHKYMTNKNFRKNTRDQYILFF